MQPVAELEPDSIDPDPNYHISVFAITVTNTLYNILSTSASSDQSMESIIDSSTHLDSHANMPVVGSGCYVFRHTGKKAITVSAFSPEYKPMDVPVVDAALMYRCPFSGTEHLLVVMNALYVPTMTHNLISPFILHEAGVTVNDKAKIHCNDPGQDDHALVFDDGFWIPMQLHGIFSFFTTTKPTDEEVERTEDVYLLTPDQFNPHHVAYALNEDATLDWEGNIIAPKD